VNSVNLIGRLVEAPALRESPAEGRRCSMRLAVPRVARGGLREPGVVYVEVVAAGLRAEDLMEAVAEGTRIGVSGRLELDEWTDDDGSRHTRYEVIADQLEVLDHPPDASGGRAAA
jgi:single-strand DNA-binding protein